MNVAKSISSPGNSPLSARSDGRSVSFSSSGQRKQKSQARFDQVAQLLEPLGSLDQYVRQAACKALAQPSLKYDNRVVDALVGRLQDRDVYVRQAAATSLGHVARRGDEAPVVALSARLSDPDACVRRVACSALGQLAERRAGSSAVASLLRRLEDKDGGVRRSAIKALNCVAANNDASVLEALFACTSDIDAFVRHVAVEVLGQLTEEGSDELILRLVTILETDVDARVRKAAATTLGNFAIPGDARVLEAVRARLDDENEGVRRAAAGALSEMSLCLHHEEREFHHEKLAYTEAHGKQASTNHDRQIKYLEDMHAKEVQCLQARIQTLERQLVNEASERDHRIARLEMECGVRSGKSWLSSVDDFVPNALKVSQFLDSLPALAGPTGHGAEIEVPVWALRILRNSSTKDKHDHWILSALELFEQLSVGKITSRSLTEDQPLDVYVHCGEDGVWGLYCSCRVRMLALVMRQACARNEFMVARCVVRPSDSGDYWGWHWGNFYDGSDGLNVTLGFGGRSSYHPHVASMKAGLRAERRPGSPTRPHSPTRRAVPPAGNTHRTNSAGCNSFSSTTASLHLPQQVGDSKLKRNAPASEQKTILEAAVIPGLHCVCEKDMQQSKSGSGGWVRQHHGRIVEDPVKSAHSSGTVGSGSVGSPVSAGSHNSPSHQLLAFAHLVENYSSDCDGGHEAHH